MTYKYAALVALAALVLNACAKTQDEKNDDVAIPAKPNALAISSSVDAGQAGALNQSVSALYLLPLDADDKNVSEMSRLMKLTSVTPDALQTWMQARVHYIVDANFDFETQISASAKKFDFPEPGVLPGAFTDSNSSTKTAEMDKSDVMMLNIGTGLYFYGKLKNQLISVNIPGVGSIDVASPREGVLQLGDGMFRKFGDMQNIGYSIVHAATLFHEARHSDGHGHTGGFMHAKCVSGDFAGEYACDRATNGAYSVGSSVLLALMQQCTVSGICKSKTSDVLSAIYIDQASRVLTTAEAGAVAEKDAQAGTDWDDSPEGKRQ